ncbi:MAG TPA: prenyltransferase/squalene oxidase repeat-containing protein [Pirellulales bacterium]|nr:prenyltransferase/squalene oxidase repeat-containing protein [Pirellulales bacterium]
MRHSHARILLCVIQLALSLAAISGVARSAEVDRRIEFDGSFSQAMDLAADEVTEISVSVVSPSTLPANGRIAVEWEGPTKELGWRKVVHALDPDVYLVYRTPQAGRYQLTLRAVEREATKPSAARWRETGALAGTKSFPERTPWPSGRQVAVRVWIRRADFGQATRDTIVETEPNNSIAQAQPLPLAKGDDEQLISVTGGADDIEYFDNEFFGESGDDWFRLEFQGSQERLLSVNLMPTDHFVAARVRAYTLDGQEYLDGKHLNETTHEQVEEHRTAIVRTLKPGGVILLRVEANSPGYDLEVRVRPPAPFTDPRDAVRLAMYDHIAQVSAWLMNRPRGNSLDRRLRDTGSLYGSNCMSCHTQSGVWGPAGPLAFGYRVENALHYRHLMNVMYESLRPTNVLKEAANNTSLAPHDLGDGPAGTRVAGYNVTTAESVIAPRKLHSMQQIRTANYMLQTSDPSGINAAGKGSNVGQAVVIRYASEVLRRAWDKTREDRYLMALEDRASKMLAVSPKFTDDLAHRIVFFRQVFPLNYEQLKSGSDQASQLQKSIDEQIKRDAQALRDSQRTDGAWGFSPGRVDSTADPAPTALAIDALVSLGADRDDPAVDRGVKALLAMQHPYGLWNRSARTGFVTTAYVLHTLSRLFPDNPPKFTRQDFEARPGESLLDTIARMRRLAYLDRWSASTIDQPPEELLDLMLEGAAHESAPVRYWAMIALGARHSEAAAPALVRGLSDPVKMVREAARWGLRQTLLDDQGWEHVFAAYEQGEDLAREQLAAALVMRADAVMPQSRVDLVRLAGMLDKMMSHDANPAVRAWAARAAWNWWVWNPPMREPLNRAFVKMVQTPEPSHLAENAKRYQLQALLIVNGNRASANYDNPYRELEPLLQAMAEATAGSQGQLVSTRLTRAAATYYSAAYGSNGTGQLGYSTPQSSETIGAAIVDFWQRAEISGDPLATQLALEAAANVIHAEVQEKLLHYAVNGPENLRSIASSSLSDPRAVLLPTAPEFVGPLVERIHANAQTEEGRRQVTRNTVRQLSRARWDMSPSENRQREFFGLLIPKLDDPSSDAQWFLAEQLGRIVASNPDFRTETLLSMIPKSFDSPLAEMFWLPSAGWMLTYDAPLPQIGDPAVPANRSELRRFALEMYVRNLSQDADRRLRTVAVSMLYQPALYSSPEVAAVARRIDAGNFRRLLPEPFERAIRQAAADDTTEPKLNLDDDRQRNFAYFRDFVLPELAQESRADGNSCFTCHGEGKVPSMSLEAPERRTRYLSPQDTWANYRTLLARIDRRNVAASKLLRKPLNIQTGEEDGHQGDMRYKPGDRGYEILKTWVHDAARLD